MIPITSVLDNGLFYASLSGSREEWMRSFPDDKMVDYGPMHIWIRCIDLDMRAFFFFENIEEGILGVSASEHKPIRGRGVYFYVDGVKVEAKLEGAGGEFIHHRERDQYSSSFHSASGEQCIHVVFEEWTRYLCVPKHHCMSPPSSSSPLFLAKSADSDSDSHSHTQIGSSGTKSTEAGIQYVINAFTWDHSVDSPELVRSLQAMVRAVEKHLSYHKCLLGDLVYELVIHPDHLPLYLASESLSAASKSGDLRFLLKGNHPPPLRGKNPNWQSIYQNIALLQYWGQDSVRIFFIDPDEFLFIDPIRRSEFNELTRVHKSVSSLSRISTVCVDCATSGGIISDGDASFTFSHHRYKRQVSSAQTIAGKLLVNPNLSGLMYVHKAYHDHGETVAVPTQLAYFLHFENFITQRISLTKEILANTTAKSSSTVEIVGASRASNLLVSEDTANDAWTDVNLTAIDLVSKCTFAQEINTTSGSSAAFLGAGELNTYLGSMTALRLRTHQKSQLFFWDSVESQESLWAFLSVIVMASLVTLFYFIKKYRKA